MSKIEKIIVISLFVAILGATYNAFSCEKPTSDKELAELYYICQGGFCLRD